MDQLIPVVNKLQDVFAAIGQQTLDLPQIVVVGSQSAGKSSVLENIVGRDFLPRGFGIVTRRPLVLQLYSITPESEFLVDKTKGDEWGEFLHLPNQRFYDFSEICAEIVRETDRITGRNRGISNKSINLKIFSPYVLNLTLVDLPGITKVPTGDQPEDVEEQIRSMCYQFISNPNAIILAVTAANQDLANSDGLKMARSVDSEGERTIGVLTKVDIMDHGTDCCDILNNKIIPLRKGYVAVMNRSQKDIQDNLPIRKGLAKESAFFQAHPKYRHLLDRCGTVNLAKTLNSILMHHIRDCLPDIKARISSLMMNIQSNLEALGDSMDDLNNSSRGATILRILSQFAANFRDKIDGNATPNTDNLSDMSELYGGARIAYIFNDVFGKRLKNFDPLHGLDDDDIRTAIANANGTRPSLFVPELSFDLLVRKQISRLEQPGMHCLDLVLEEMQRMVQQSETVELSRFPALRIRTMEIVHRLLHDCLGPAQKMIANLIQIELAYINTSHPDFIGGKAAVSAAQQHKKLAVQGTVEAPVGKAQGNVTNNGNSNVTTTADLHQQNLQQHNHMMQQQHQQMGFQQPQPAGGFFSMFQQPHNTSLKGTVSSRPTDTNLNNNINNPPMLPPQSQENYNKYNIKLPQVPDRMRCASTPSDRERVETEIIKILITSYFDIVKKNYVDLVPKAIMHFLVMMVKENLQNELVSQLYKEQLLADLMKETDDIASKRKAFREMKELLLRAIDIVNEVRDFQPGGK
mmetsp:Transcript_2441/g.3374  ORF Transcript_2441/g.3374 Transcript_2441/m.3374 type:complete len:749 (-) Transcript_2441:107-2353(-)